MKIVPISLTLLFALLFPFAELLAAPNDPPPPTPPPPPGLPVDSGIIFLLAISLVYGLYKIHKISLHKKNPL